MTLATEVQRCLEVSHNRKWVCRQTQPKNICCNMLFLVTRAGLGKEVAPNQSSRHKTEAPETPAPLPPAVSDRIQMLLWCGHGHVAVDLEEFFFGGGLLCFVYSHALCCTSDLEAGTAVLQYCKHVHSLTVGQPHTPHGRAARWLDVWPLRHWSHSMHAGNCTCKAFLTGLAVPWDGCIQ